VRITAHDAPPSFQTDLFPGIKPAVAIFAAYLAVETLFSSGSSGHHATNGGHGHEEAKVRLLCPTTTAAQTHFLTAALSNLFNLQLDAM